MENRKPFQLKNILIYYNLFQVIFSTWLFYEVSFGFINKRTLEKLHLFCFFDYRLVQVAG